MNQLQVRFEQKRGHFMIIDRDPPFSRVELNDMQLQMLTNCEIPGLLPLEIEDWNGSISLRYSLTGHRMMSESMRTASWSMPEMMGALYHLVEVLEASRLYLLDADRIRLHDDFIFIGQDWQDMRFTYIPIDMPTLHQSDDLERLIIRWMMKVNNPEGKVLQEVLRIISVKDFTPLFLIRFIRQYMTRLNEPFRKEGAIEKEKPEWIPVYAEHRVPTESREQAMPRIRNIPASDSAAFVTSGSLIGDDSGPLNRHFAAENDGLLKVRLSHTREPLMEIGRWRTILLSTLFLLNAVYWRYGLEQYQGREKLLYGLIVTLLSLAVLLFLWKGLTKRRRVQRLDESSDDNTGYSGLYGSIGRDKETEDSIDSDNFVIPPIQNHLYNQNHPSSPAIKSRFKRATASARPDSDSLSAGRMKDDSLHNSLYPQQSEPSIPAMNTEWLPNYPDRTTLLECSVSVPAQTYFLEWSVKGSPRQIPLHGSPFVIGRSADAVQHVDGTSGISRAHLEMTRMESDWKAKDLGSRNGSRINDKPMTAYEWYPLQPGDRLQLAGSQYTFRQGGM